MRLRAGVLVGAAALFGAGTVGLSATPAGASNRQVSAVGSFTTYVVMHALFPTSLNDLLPGGVTTKQRIVGTTTYCKGGINFTTTTKFPTGAPNGSTAGKTFLAGEETTTTTRRGCVTIGRSSSPPKPSTISTHFDYYAFALDGVTAMLGANANVGSTSTFTNGKPVTLSQIRAIYRCFTVGTNKTVRTWKQAGLGTSTTTINRFWPQPGSGTQSVGHDILGFTPSKAATVPHCTTPTRPTIVVPAITSFHTVTVTIKGVPTIVASVPNEENTESGLVYGTKLLGKSLKNDIMWYSAGKYASEWNNTTEYGTTKNNRINQKTIGNFTPTQLELARIRLRKLTGTFAVTTAAGTPKGFVKFTTTAGKRLTKAVAIKTTTVSETNEWYSHIASNAKAATTSQSLVPGVRYIWNECDTATPGYNLCKEMVGFDNQKKTWPTKTQTTGAGTKSALCAGKDAATITANGFVPLSSSKDPKKGNAAKATCREWVGKSYPGLATPKHWTANTWRNPTTR